MVYRPTKHIIGHIGDGFYGSNDQTNSVKALKEVVVLRIGFNPTRSTSPCYNTIHTCSHTENTYIHKNESKHTEMDPVRQNPIQRTVMSVNVCALHCAQLLHTKLHRTDLPISLTHFCVCIIACMCSIVTR